MKKTETGFILIPAYLLLIFFLNIISCSNSSDKRSHPADTKGDNFLGYNLTHPDETFFLPPVLHEISGITLIDSSSIACVQDENGIVFVYDVQKRQLRSQSFFDGDGDYEGITKAGGTIYVLRSDGLLFEIKSLKTSDLARTIPLKGIPYNEIEGLCYDQKNNRLFIAPKDKPKDSEEKNKRGIYGFDLNRGALLEKPVISIDISKIKKFATDNKVFDQVKSEKKDKDDKPDIKFRPSAIGIHPVTGKLFVISATEQILFVFNINGTIEKMSKLNPEIYNMPEGITFFKNGDMLISNEGQNRNATIIRLNYNPD